MAGFLDRAGNLVTRISDSLRDLSGMSLKYGDLVNKNSFALGVSQTEFGGQMAGGDGYDEFMAALGVTDTSMRKYIAFYDADYRQKVKELRKFAMNGEIEFILDTLADEAICYDDYNFFAYPKLNNLDLKEKYIDELQETYNHIYNSFMFNTDISAWDYFRQWLIDGVICFEIIYDDPADPKEIIGFKELEPSTVQPATKKDLNGEMVRVWYQEDPITGEKRELYESQIIYISYAKSNVTSRISYVERLVRSFNILRIMEHTRVIWAVMNATFRMKMVVPVGSRSEQKSRQVLAQFRNYFKEEIFFDNDSGHLEVNGQPGIQFYKNYVFPERQGSTPEIDSIAFDGPDLSDTDALKWFHDKLKQDSKIPYERFERETGSGTFTIGADGINRDEIRFSNFIKRLRSAYQELFIKPLFIQMTLKYPELKDDTMFRSQLGLEYVENNMFAYLKKAELLERQVMLIDTLGNITGDDGMEPLFKKMPIVKQFLTGITPEEQKMLFGEGVDEDGESDDEGSVDDFLA